MTKLYVTEFSTVAVTPVDGRLMPVGQKPGVANQAITVTGSSQQSALFNAEARLVRLHAQVACHIAVGSNPTATTNSMRLAEGQTEYFGVVPGHRLAVIAG